MKTKNNFKQRLLVATIFLALLFSMMPAMTMTAKASGVGTQQSIAITATDDGVGVGSAIDLKQGHGSDGNGFLAGAYPFGSSGTVTTNDGIKYNFASNTFEGNDSIRLAPGYNKTMNLQTIGAYQNIYVLATAGGVGSTTPASFSVTLTYTDNSTTNTSYALYDWCNVPNPSGAGATDPFYRYATGTALPDTGVKENVRLYSKSIAVDKNKLLKSITFENSSRDVFALVFAVTGVTPVGVPAAPTNLTATLTANGFNAGWTAPSGTVKGYYIDVATDENFLNIVGGYNNKQIVGSTPQQEITGLTKGTTYYYRVRAYNDNGQSLSSIPANFVYTDPLPVWATDAGLNDSNAMWNETTKELKINDDVQLVEPLNLPEAVTINVAQDKTLTAPTGKPAITTNSNLNIGGDGTIKGGGADSTGNGSPAISATGGNVTIAGDSTVEGGDATTGTGGSAIQVTGNNTTITNNGTATGGSSTNGTGGSGIASTGDVTVNGGGSVTGGGSTNGAGGSGITSNGNTTVNGGGSVSGGASTSGAGGSGIASGGNVTTGEGAVSGGSGATNGGDGIKTTGGNSTVNTGIGNINGGNGGSGTGGNGISSTGDVTTDGNVSGGSSTSGTGGNGIDMPNGGEVKADGNVTGGSSTSGTGGHGISSGESLNVNGGGSVSGGGSTTGTGGNGITVPKDKDVAVQDDSKINGGTGGSGDESGGIVIEDDGYTIDYINEKITIKSGYEAKIKGSSDAFSNTVTFNPNTTYEIKKSDGSGTTVDFTTVSRPNKPAVTQKQETVQGKMDGTIVGATNKMEYSTDGGTTWKDVTVLPLTGLSNETVSIRTKATHGTPCSETVDLTFTASTITLKVIFNVNGGTQTPAQEGISYGVEIPVTQPTKAGYSFDGWYIDQAFTKYWGTDGGKVLDNYTLYAKWIADSVAKYNVSGNITDGSGGNVSGATVEIYKGKQLIATTTTEADGSYTFSDIPPGEYNIVITKDGKVKTIPATVGSGGATVDVELPTKSVSSKVEVKQGAPAVVVAGLDKVAEAQTLQAGETSIEVKLEVESKTDENAPAGEVSAIKVVAAGNGNNNTEFIDMTVTKTTSSGSGTVETIMTDTTEVLEIIIPYDMSGKQNITVYRYHNGGASAFTKLTARPAAHFSDATYFVGADYIAVYTNQFSTYAIGYTTSSGSGSTSGSAGSYFPQLVAPKLEREVKYNVWEINNSGDTFASNGYFAKFEGIWIHGFSMPSNCYTATRNADGTVSVTLADWYVRTLDYNEEHLLHFVFDDGFGVTKFYR